MNSTRLDFTVFADHYKILETTFGADELKVKLSFRRLAKKYHPDHYKGDVGHFLKVITAYEILKNKNSRADYDRIYLSYLEYLNKKSQTTNHKFLANNNYLKVIHIPPSRIHYAARVALLARKGLLKKSVTSKERYRNLHINYDMELYLYEKELKQPVKITVPVIVRTLCPECLGSDMHCDACNGKGSYKSGRTLMVYVASGLVSGQILDIDLSKRKLGRTSYFKKNRIRILTIAIPDTQKNIGVIHHGKLL